MKKEQLTPGWKVFNKDLKCGGYNFEIGKTYKEAGEPKLCHNGFHFHTEKSHLFNYYDFDPTNRVCEIVAHGKIDQGDDKTCCCKIAIIRELNWNEVLNLINTGIGNSGRNNSGSYNSGRNNSGSYNSGRYNSGSYNSGSYNSGNYNSGSNNSGSNNSGRNNSGRNNSGRNNSGSNNSGSNNSGSYNSGNYNSGIYNSGSNNSGIYNSGSNNSGSYNSGSNNSGIYNSGSYCGGLFNTTEQPVTLFNGAATVLMSEFKNTKQYDALFSSEFPLNDWIYEGEMTDQEKIDNPNFFVLGGYLKTLSYKEACVIWWKNMMSEDNKRLIQDIPGFSKEIFKEITGIEL